MPYMHKRRLLFTIMQATVDREKRREYRQKILKNLSEIVNAIDDLDRVAAEARNHLHQHDRFFFRHGTGLQEDETYGTENDLVDLYLDTCQVLNRLKKAHAHMETACSLVHYYDYTSNEVFADFARAEAEHL
jgi:hypothetical protein